MSNVVSLDEVRRAARENRLGKGADRDQVSGAERIYATLDEFDANLAFRQQVELFRYWHGLQNGEGLPRRGDFDPTQVPKALGSLGLIDVEYPRGGANRPEFRYRLVGSEIQEFYDESLKGKNVREVKNPAYADYLIGLYLTAVNHAGPICVQENNNLASGYYNFRGRIYLPAEADHAGRPTILIYSTLDTRRAELNIKSNIPSIFPQDKAVIWLLDD